MMNCEYVLILQYYIVSNGYRKIDIEEHHTYLQYPSLAKPHQPGISGSGTKKAEWERHRQRRVVFCGFEDM